MKVFVTGATGFVGQRIVECLLEQTEATIQLAVRQPDKVKVHERINTKRIDTISQHTNWQAILDGCDTVIHAAARVHMLNEDSQNPSQAYHDVNTAGTLNLAQQAVESGVRRFVFLSTVKVHGESSLPRQALCPEDPVRPVGHYAQSKYEAEQGLMALGKQTGLEIVIIRPVLVYGAGVKANFYSMLDFLNRGKPLPLGRVNNQRSFIYVDNLADFTVTCALHPNAGNEIFLVSDGEDISTTNLLKKLSFHLGKKALLLPLPVWLVRSIAAATGKTVEAARLCDSLHVNIEKASRLLGWQPSVSLDEALQQTVASYKRMKSESK